MSIINQTYFDTYSRGEHAGQTETDYNQQLRYRQEECAKQSNAEQCEVKQSHIFYAMQHLENQVEQVSGKFDALLRRLRVVSRDPKLAQEDNKAMPKREGNSELAQRLNGVMNGLDELDRRIAMQLEMLEI